MKIISITWKDAVGADGWAPSKVVRESRTATIHSVGYLVHEDAEAITITMAIDVDNDNLGAFMVIPKSGILKRKIISS